MPIPPAPGADAHPSLALVNTTVAFPGGNRVDELATSEGATAWLIDHGLAPEDAALQAYCRKRLTGLRDDLRAVFSTKAAGVELDPKSLGGINEALTTAPHVSLLGYDHRTGFFRSTEHPTTQLVEHAMSIIAEDAAALLTGAQAELVAQCESSPCVRFYLRTHARRQWCSTRCGDRVRAARAYSRKRGPAGGPAATDRTHRSPTK